MILQISHKIAILITFITKLLMIQKEVNYYYNLSLLILILDLESSIKTNFHQFFNAVSINNVVGIVMPKLNNLLNFYITTIITHLNEHKNLKLNKLLLIANN